MNVNMRQALLASAVLALGGFGIAGASAAPSDTAATPPSAIANHTPAQAAVASADSRTMMQRVELRITELHKALHVTAAQQPQWDGFVTVMRDNARQLDAAVITDADTLAKMTAVEQMQTYAKITEQHAKDVRNLVPAFGSLYDAMSPEQKLNADNYFRAEARRARHGGKA